MAGSAGLTATQPKETTLALAAADDLAAILPRWQDWLAIERQFSSYTVTAYVGDLTAFLGFFAGHRGHPIRLRDLAEAGLVDPGRIAIHGGSAGGFTVLAALSQSSVFAAGGDFYGVADLEALARDTHKFESRYLDNLVGPYPAAKDVYDARSPLNHLEGFAAPLIIFQGSDDPIVPPNQAHMILTALRERKQPVAYLEFAGESHGFRKAETLIASKEAELYFYGRVFGITPADDLPKIAIENLSGSLESWSAKN